MTYVQSMVGHSALLAGDVLRDRHSAGGLRPVGDVRSGTVPSGGEPMATGGGAEGDPPHSHRLLLGQCHTFRRCTLRSSRETTSETATRPEAYAPSETFGPTPPMWAGYTPKGTIHPCLLRFRET